MPPFLLVALFLAFGIDPPHLLAPFPRSELGPTLARILAAMGFVAALSFGLGRLIAARAARKGRVSATLRRQSVWAARILEVVALLAYGGIVHRWGWPELVRGGLGLRGVVFLADALILLPYVLMQVAIWWGSYAVERALRPGRAAGLGRHLTLRARQTLGLVLPILLVFTLGQDAIRRQWPGWVAEDWKQPIEVAVMGALVLVLSPVFVRLAWPTRPLPEGALRDRLEHLMRRLGFRCTDILIWDTGNVIVNAGVTGSLPRFRYVLLTDALVDYLDDHEIAAVFGHEIGHIAHRHLLDFGVFFLGSLGVLALFGKTIDDHLGTFTAHFIGQDRALLATIVQAALILAGIGAYLLVVFGHVSRRFERQADVFGCQAVSCGQADCPPHLDLDRLPDRGPARVLPCPVGIRIFANALANVAHLNGMEPRARSWRHGSIARRIAFLEGLEGRPDAVRRFQVGVSRLRLAIALALVAAIVVAFATGSIEHLR